MVAVEGAVIADMFLWSSPEVRVRWLVLQPSNFAG
jgi:hypothetical protein